MSETGTRVRTVHVLVQGTVQGVGFRYHCAYTAQELGVVGQVRNLPDGDVEVMAQGEPDAVARLISWLKRGPRWASVRSVAVTDLRAGCLENRRFEISG